MSNPRIPKVDHLLLLVGANPVPNAVAACLMAAPGGHISLIHSKRTLPTAQHLQKWLTECGHTQVRLREILESSPYSIIQGVQSELEDINSKNVGLHYTGGTKAMSVHAYRALEHWADARAIKPVSTYLDARRLELVIDPTDPWSAEHNHVEYVGEAVMLGLQELINLHVKLVKIK